MLSIKKLQEDFDSLERWCSSNGIRVNTDKTKLMIFGSKCSLDKLPDFEVTMNNVALKQVSSYNYLGMTLDCQLKYDKHVQRIINTVSGKLVQFRRMRSFLNDRAALLIYKNMFLPIIEYGDAILTGVSALNKKRLQVLQNRGLRCALKSDDYTSSDSLHKEAKLLKLEYRREIHLLNLMYDISLNPKTLVTRSTLGVSTRSSGKKTCELNVQGLSDSKKA